MSVNSKALSKKIDFLSQVISDSRSVKEKLLLEPLRKDFEEIINAVIRTLGRGGTIFTAGNGGSAGDANHFAAELSGKFENKNRRPLPSVSLAANPSVITAIGNDFGFEEIFSRQIEGLGRPNDLLVCFSTSGNSQNLVLAARSCHRKKLKVAGLLGREGGLLAKLCDYRLIVPSKSTPRIQEAHELIFHLICHFVDLYYAS